MSGNSEIMNLRRLEERTTRSKSPKRYSLNRKIKEKERKQVTDQLAKVDRQPSSHPASLRQNARNETSRSAEKLPCYEIQKRDHNTVEKKTSTSEVQVSQDNKVCCNSPAAEKKTCSTVCTSNNNTQNSAPVSRKPGVNTSSMVPCSPGDFRSIANQLKTNPPRRPQNLYYPHVPHTNCNPNYAAQHYGNVQGIQGLQPPSPFGNGVSRTNVTHPVLQNVPQGNHFVPPYMTPNQGAGFQFGQIGMQRNSEAYNAFTAYGNPFGMFWSQRN